MDPTDLMIKDTFSLAIPEHVDYKELIYYFIPSYILCLTILSYLT